MATNAQAAKISQQIHYYFSDANFRRDKFLREKVNEDADGYVPISVLLTFNRLKQLTTDPAEIVAALQDSNELEISEDKLAVRRVKPLPSDDDSDTRTAYVKAPFPDDYTLDQLIAYLSAYGDIKRVHMRRLRRKDATSGNSFKGSVFVEFGAIQEMTAFVDSFKAGTLKFEDRPLEKVETKLDYLHRKAEERQQRKAARVSEKATSRADAYAADAADSKGTRTFNKDMTPGVILRIEGMGAAANQEALQAYLETVLGTDEAPNLVRYIEISESSAEGSASKGAYLRFTQADACKKVKDAADATDNDNFKTAVHGEAPKATVLEGEEEQAYWEKVWAAQQARIEAKSRRGRGRGRGGARGGRGGRGGRGDNMAGKKRSRDGDDGAPAAKRARTD